MVEGSAGEGFFVALPVGDDQCLGPLAQLERVAFTAFMSGTS